MNKLYVISGPSGSGKSTLLFNVVKAGLCENVSKFSTRQRRRGELDDITTVNSENEVNINCDIIYRRYGNLYGINTSKIRERLKYRNQIVIISDISSIIKLREIFKLSLVTIYISLSDQTFETLIYSYLQRNNLQRLDINLLYLGSKVSDSIRSNHDESALSYSNTIKMLIRQQISEKEYLDFSTRVDSWLNSRMIYRNNSHLFDYLVSGQSSVLLNKISNIINSNNTITN